MNKIRRKQIRMLINRLRKINSGNISIDEIVDITEDAQIIRDDEEYYMENIPENLQSGERYEAAEMACDNLNDASDMLEDLCECDIENENIKEMIDEIINLLDNATA